VLIAYIMAFKFCSCCMSVIAAKMYML